MWRVMIAVVLLALSLLPVGAWLDASFQRALAFADAQWWSGALLVVLGGILLWLPFRDDTRAAAVARPFRAVVGVWERHPWRVAVAFASCAVVLYAVTGWLVFDARPLLIDEIVQVIQARVFASGDLWLPADAHPEFRSIMHMVEQDGRWYGQFPPGGPAMLALGELVRAPWIVNPVAGGVSIVAFAMALRWAGFSSAVSIGAPTIFALAPFQVFQASSHMNHITSTMWVLVAVAALVRATHAERDRPLAGLVCGLGLGVAATIRPLDAAAFALPAAAWLAARAVRNGHWRSFVLSGVGVAAPMALMMWINMQTTGGALTFGYSVLWGDNHGLGFHVSPWGEQHTVERGVALVAAYLNRLNEFLFEVPVPSLIAPLAAFALARRSAPLERYLLVTAAGVLGAYFAYWHDGFYLGPRFLVPLMPVLALLVARLPGIVAERWSQSLLTRGVFAAYAAAALLGGTLVLPHRVRAYQNGFQSLRWDYDDIAARAGATGDVILVRESWGAQVIARLWAIGVSRSFAEILYRKVDTCGLDHATAALEASSIRGEAAEERLRPLLADSARVVASPFSPDATERVLPGSMYPPLCQQRIAEDRAGYTHFAPTLLARDTSTRWVRDLHARDTLLNTNDARIWLLRRTPDTTSVVPVLLPLDRDSLVRAWYGVEAQPDTTIRQGGE